MKIKRPFNDSDLPLNDLSIERTEEIERLVLPRIKKAAKRLRKEKPHLFRKKIRQKLK